MLKNILIKTHTVTVMEDDYSSFKQYPAAPRSHQMKFIELWESQAEKIDCFKVLYGRQGLTHRQNNRKLKRFKWMFFSLSFSIKGNKYHVAGKYSSIQLSFCVYNWCLNSYPVQRLHFWLVWDCQSSLRPPDTHKYSVTLLMRCLSNTYRHCKMALS